MNIELERYYGLGNDYLVLDPNKNELPLTPENIKLLCNRNFGLGSDGILLGPIIQETGMLVRVFNPDGTEAEKSGNGVRIFAKYLKDADYVQKTHVRFNTLGGPVEAYYLNEEGSRLKISMGNLSFWSDDIPVTGPRREVINEEMEFNHVNYLATCVTIGNPHCIIPMLHVSKDQVCRIGWFAESAEYFPKRINTQIMQVIDRNNIQIEIFERGAGYTLASGSGACAAAGAAYRMGLTDEKMYVHMPGGVLEVEIGEDYSVLMTGDVCHIGKISLSHSFSERLRSI
ncbi:MAG: diaminopimelate epimerase [Eubacteriales bacterium]|nr:diaminopimelate epimerase [Eubacteriales bacterium]